MIIVFDGIDGTGKSGLIERIIAENPDKKIVTLKSVAPVGDCLTFFKASNQMILDTAIRNKDTIFLVDRFIVSNHVCAYIHDQGAEHYTNFLDNFFIKRLVVESYNNLPIYYFELQADKNVINDRLSGSTCLYDVHVVNNIDQHFKEYRKRFDHFRDGINKETIQQRYLNSWGKNHTLIRYIPIKNNTLDDQETNSKIVSSIIQRGPTHHIDNQSLLEILNRRIK